MLSTIGHGRKRPEIAGSSSGGIGTQRRQAAVFRALKKSLLESPKEIYQVIEN